MHYEKKGESKLSHTKSNTLPLGCDNHNLLVHFNAILISKDSWKHDLGSIADSIHLAYIVYRVIFSEILVVSLYS